MPLYEYRCEACDHRFEILQRLGAGAETLSCPRCAAPRLAKQFSTFAATADPGGAAARPAAGGCCQGTPT